jgi:hypothetical protein
MRIIRFIFIVLLLATPAMAHAQGLSVQAAAGPTLGDTGFSLAAGFAFSPTSRITLVGNIERSHLPSRLEQHPGGVSYFRGGTFTLGAAELQVSLFPRGRVSPYGLVGFGAGRSRPNVTDIFPTPVDNRVSAPFAGGGLRVPLAPRLSLFTDLRLALIVGTESDDLYALTPLRAGFSWQF